MDILKRDQYDANNNNKAVAYIDCKVHFSRFHTCSSLIEKLYIIKSPWGWKCHGVADRSRSGSKH